ncbi:MAG TPA: hypothetical protein VIW94_05435 [Acidimicrobiia bacterium]
MDKQPQPWLAKSWEVAGALGMVVAGLAAVVFALAVGPWFAALEDSLAVSARALDAVDQTVEVIDESLIIFEETLVGVDGVFEQTQASLDEISAVVLSTATLLSEDIPDQVAAIQTAMEGLIDTANVVDGILGALSFVGVDYNPEVPLDEALEDVNTELGELGATLSDNADDLYSLTVSLNRLNEEIGSTGDSLAGLTVQLEESRRLIADYQSTSGDAQILLEEASDRLSGQVWIVRVLGVALLFFLGIALSAVWWLGRSFRSPGQEPVENQTV